MVPERVSSTRWAEKGPLTEFRQLRVSWQRPELPLLSCNLERIFQSFLDNPDLVQCVAESLPASMCGRCVDAFMNALPPVVMNLRMKFIGALLWGEFMKFRLDPTSILRERARMAARFLQAHFAEVGQPYLREIVGPFVQRHLDPKISYEVDPARCKDAALRAQNMVALTNASEELFTLITSADSLERMPYPIRASAALVMECARHMPEAREWALPIVGGLIILKFFNPAVITPIDVGILPADTKLEPFRRSLLLLSKVLQGLSTGGGAV
ncbi:putative Ras GTPase-activating protein 3 [Paratrimastix pyriformis]|uniref:Ras GTPase-activating protein 3 n=1 Tax=Paratrimastix pyriformis TaxID=342808 RepID=A0ABQ8U6K4_9EUKA|nr:putative Ras GTPase-activating protein 3 [Paratrimastix pyriformis]